jgi:hypothetical protein
MDPATIGFHSTKQGFNNDEECQQQRGQCKQNQAGQAAALGDDIIKMFSNAA